MLRVPRFPTPLPVPISTIERAPPSLARRPHGTVPPEEEWHSVTPPPIPPSASEPTLVMPALRPSLAPAFAAVLLVAIAIAVMIARL